MDVVFSDATVRQTFADFDIAYRIQRDLVDGAVTQDLVAATQADRRKETCYRDRARRTKFIPFALETYGALSDRSDRFLVECTTLSSRECARS